MNKPGWKTSEFWLVTLSWLVATLLSSGVLVEGGTGFKIVSFAAAALATLGYGAGRSYVKAKETEAAKLLSALKLGDKN